MLNDVYGDERLILCEVSSFSGYILCIRISLLVLGVVYLLRLMFLRS